MRLNSLDLIAYSTTGTNPIHIPGDELRKHAEGFQFSTGYPGGLFLDASFIIPRKIAHKWKIDGGKRIVALNSQSLAYEGYVSDLDRIISGGSEEIEISLQGAWGWFLMNNGLRKHWVDDRISKRVWPYIESATAADKCFVDRNNRIRLIPKAEAWANGEAAAVFYLMPTGQTIKRVALDYDFKEGAQAWELRLRDTVSGTNVWSLTSSASGSRDDTLATPRTQLNLQLIARANQTPTSDGTYYGEISNVKVYSETGNINFYEIASDIVGSFSAFLNSDLTRLDSGHTRAILPFITDWNETLADILIRAAGYGDNSDSPIAVYILPSTKAASYNGKPVLGAESYPALTDWDFEIYMEEAIGAAAITQDFDAVRNWIAVKYRDARGFVQWRTPDDDASLKDDDSISDWGTKVLPVDIGEGTATIAADFGARLLARYKDPVWTSPTPITVVGSIAKRRGGELPASLIAAGKRVRIKNYLSSLSGVDPVLRIARTTYDDASESCTLSFGPPPPLLAPSFTHPVVISEPFTSVKGEEDLSGEDSGESLDQLYPGISHRPALQKILKRAGLSWKEFKALPKAERIRIRKKYGG